MGPTEVVSGGHVKILLAAYTAIVSRVDSLELETWRPRGDM